MTLPKLPKARLAFDIVDASNQAHIECKTMLRDMISRGQAHQYARDMAQWENARLQPLLEQLIRCVKALEQIRDNPNTGIYHDGSGESIAKKALTALRDSLGER